MIIDTSQGNIEVVGDIKEFKTSIDPKNLEYIITLLSSNLYSDPEQSFIREIVSNAWDSHVEAGNTDTPVIIRFKNQNYDKSVTIRDYGTGLSPERFAEVYCNIGSSTKRDSNNFIGGFGIGKYSSLACSNTVYITSYYNGIAYYYVMVKSGNSITTNLLSEMPTVEKNGVEITIRNISSFVSYEKALDYIVFFPNVYIDGIDSYINSTKIKRLNHIALSSKKVRHRLLLGNVLYPCDESLLPRDVSSFLYDISNTGIVVKFEIGELGITPNRENIIYTSDNVDKISSRVRKAKQELLDLIKKNICKDYQNLEDYYNIFKRSLHYNPLEDSINTKYDGYPISSSDIENMGITYKGVNLKDHHLTINGIYNYQLPKFKAAITEDKIYTSNKLPNRLYGWDYIRSKKILNCKQSTRLTATIKEFLKKYYSGYVIVDNLTKSDVVDYLSSNVYELEPKRGHLYRDLIIDGVWESLLSKMKDIDFDTDPDYLTFKASLAANKITTTVKIKETLLHKHNINYCSKDILRFSTFQQAIEYIKKLNKGIIIINTDDDLDLWRNIAKIKKLELFTAKKEVVTEIRALNLRCVVDTGWLLRNDPLINKVYTVYQYYPDGISKTMINRLSYTLDKSVFNELAVIGDYCNFPYYYVEHCINVGKIDPNIKYLCEKLSFYLTKWNESTGIIGDAYVPNSKVMAAALIMKTKAYKINAEAYNDVKSNKFLRILCRK